MAVSAAQEAFRVVPCPSCEPGRSPRLKLVDPYQNPEAFWLLDSYWRHCQERHTPECAWVGEERIKQYLTGRLGPEDDLRLMLHLGGCKNCRALLDAKINSLNGVPPRPTFPEG